MAAHTDISAIENPLHRLLLTATPPDLSGEVTLTYLASLLGVARFTIYKWLAAGRLPAERAIDVVKHSRGMVTLDDFHPFVYGVSADEIRALSGGQREAILRQNLV